MTPHPPRSTGGSLPRPRPRRALALALTAAMALTLVPTPMPALAQAAGPVEIDLEGAWRFQGDDDPAWADPSFDDTDWDEVEVPREGGHEYFDEVDGFGWYRLTFDLPADIAGTNLVASLGFIDDVDEAFLNGVRIGGSGVFPPEPNSQWFERRLYPVPADAPNFGGSNTLAVRMYDDSGAGGWYQGPVGLFSKEALRKAVYGIESVFADAATTAAVTALLDEQRAALAAGDVARYLDTLTADHVHDGRDRDRRERELTSWLAQSGGSLTLMDAGVEVLDTVDGELIVDTNRRIMGTRDGAAFEFQPEVQQFLTIDRSSLLEAGNRSRFFRDFVESDAEQARREYVVYLPPSYYDRPDADFPVVYMLHGFNGGAREWEPRDFGTRLDEVYGSGELAESIVVMPDGESLWYSDTETTPWRTMFVEDMIPHVDAEYRTIDDRDYRGLSGVSMGGFGSWSLGWSYPELFSSISSHMGSLGFTGVPGYATPLEMVGDLEPALLARYDYFMDVCKDDFFGFGATVPAMSAALDAKGVDHTGIVYPTGTHDDACWLPRIEDSFGMHSDHVKRANLGCSSTVAAFPDDRRAGVTCLERLGLVAGFADGTFRPLNAVTRRQTSTLLVRLLDRVQAGLPAGDQPTDRLVAAGILRGQVGGGLELNATTTRGQFASLIDRAMTEAGYPLPDGDVDAFTDLSAAGTHDVSLAKLHAVGLLRGYPDDTMRSNTALNRRQTASVMLRAAIELDGRVEGGFPAS